MCPRMRSREMEEIRSIDKYLLSEFQTRRTACCNPKEYSLNFCSKQLRLGTDNNPAPRPTVSASVLSLSSTNHTRTRKLVIPHTYPPSKLRW